MKKLWLLTLGVYFLIFPAFSAETETRGEQIYESEDSVIYGNRKISSPKFIELPPEEDDLYDGVEVKPLDATLSSSERMQENSGNFNDEEKPRLSELLCSDEKLRVQVGNFVYEYITKQPKGTVPEQRAQVLLARNMKPFTEIKEADLKKNFEASAALMHLKMNENREIYKICVSSNNAYKNFGDIYLIIYPFLQYYKVVVANMIKDSANTEDATFIYNW